MGYVTVGHFSNEEFQRSLRISYGGEVELLEGWEEAIERTHFRNRPLGNGGEGMVMDRSDGEGKGSYPAMWLDGRWTREVK